jgi:hypothetical protein
MKNVSTITELVNVLGSGKIKFDVYADGQKLNTQKINSQEVNLESYLRSLFDQHSPQNFTVNFGQSNGTSWKNPQLITLISGQQGLNQNYSPQPDFIATRAAELPTDSGPELRTKNWLLQTHYGEVKEKHFELKAKHEVLKHKFETLEKELRQKQILLEDTERKHQREIEDVNKPDLIDKVMTAAEKPENLALIKEIIANKTQGLNGPQLNEHGKKVVEAMQQHPELSGPLLVIVPHLTDEAFLAGVQKLMQPQGAQKLKLAN